MADITGLPLEKVEQIQTLFERGDKRIAQIRTSEFYRACVAVGIGLPTADQRKTKAGRMNAILRLKLFWGLLEYGGSLRLKTMLQEQTTAIRGVQYELRQLNRNLAGRE